MATVAAAFLTAKLVQADVAIHWTAISGGATLVATCLALIHGHRRRAEVRTRDELVAIAHACRRWRPGDPRPLWLNQFHEMTTTYRQLHPSKRAHLSVLHDDAWTARSHARACASALRKAQAAHRLDVIGDDLNRLRAESDAAAMAAAAVLVRDLIPAADFQLMTEPWVTCGLPIPGGDVHGWWTVRLYVAQGKLWRRVGPTENIQAPNGEDAQALLDGVFAQLTATQKQRDLVWRVRIWHGADANTNLKPAAEKIARPALTGAER